MRLAIIALLVVPLIANAEPRESPSIFWSAIANDVHMAEYYVSHGGAVNIFDEHGLTPLMYAADKGNYEMVEFLLNVGADPSFKTPTGTFAVDMGRNEKVRKLLQSRMKFNSSSTWPIVSLLRGYDEQETPTGQKPTVVVDIPRA